MKQLSPGQRDVVKRLTRFPLRLTDVDVRTVRSLERANIIERAADVYQLTERGWRSASHIRGAHRKSTLAPPAPRS